MGRNIKKEYSDRFFGAKVIQVVQTQQSRGNGTNDDPIRIVTVYHSLDGELLAVNDPNFDDC